MNPMKRQIPGEDTVTICSRIIRESLCHRRLRLLHRREWDVDQLEQVLRERGARFTGRKEASSIEEECDIITTWPEGQWEITATPTKG